MGKIKNILKFYILATTLKDKIRSGAEIWHVSKERLESVAEHIYGVCILAIAIDSEYEFDINIDKVIKMLVIHELEEVSIGDLTPFDNISKQEKNKIGEIAVQRILQDLIKKEEYFDLTKEYNERNTNDSKFASHCDKLELMLQMKLYEEQGYSDMHSEENKDLLEQKWIKKLIQGGSRNVSDLFVDYHISSFGDEEVFCEIAKYIRNNDMLDDVNEKDVEEASVKKLKI